MTTNKKMTEATKLTTEYTYREIDDVLASVHTTHCEKTFYEEFGPRHGVRPSVSDNSERIHWRISVNAIAKIFFANASIAALESACCYSR